MDKVAIVLNWEKNTQPLSLVTEDLLKAHVYTSITKIIILKNTINNIEVIQETSFIYVYIIVRLYFVNRRNMLSQVKQ